MCTTIRHKKVFGNFYKLSFAVQFSNFPLAKRCKSLIKHFCCCPEKVLLYIIISIFYTLHRFIFKKQKAKKKVSKSGLVHKVPLESFVTRGGSRGTAVVWLPPPHSFSPPLPFGLHHTREVSRNFLRVPKACENLPSLPAQKHSHSLHLPFLPSNLMFSTVPGVGK